MCSNRRCRMRISIKNRVLVCGWFSFPGAPATAGDLLSRDVLGEWLRITGVPFDCLVTPPFNDGIRIDELRRDDYTDVVVVCGPYIDGSAITDLLRSMPNARRHGVNL